MSEENDKLTDLQSTLSNLQSRLASTSETITESYPYGTDEEGKTIWKEREVTNPEYIALCSLISDVENEITQLKKR